jgi:flagellar biosynthesis protein FlhB
MTIRKKLTRKLKAILSCIATFALSILVAVLIIWLIVKAHDYFGTTQFYILLAVLVVALIGEYILAHHLPRYIHKLLRFSERLKHTAEKIARAIELYLKLAPVASAVIGVISALIQQ